MAWETVTEPRKYRIVQTGPLPDADFVIERNIPGQLAWEVLDRCPNFLYAKSKLLTIKKAQYPAVVWEESF